MASGPIDANVQKFIEEHVSNLIWGVEQLNIKGELLWLRQLVIEQRMISVHRRIHTILMGYVLAQEISLEVKEAAINANGILQLRSEWFTGAFQETDNPVTVYDEWLETLGEQLTAHSAVLGFPLVHESDRLPHPPESVEE